MKPSAPTCTVCTEPVWFTVEGLCRRHGNAAGAHIDTNDLIDLPIVDLPAKPKSKPAPPTDSPQGDNT